MKVNQRGTIVRIDWNDNVGYISEHNTFVYYSFFLDELTDEQTRLIEPNLQVSFKQTTDTHDHFAEDIRIEPPTQRRLV